MDFKISLVIIYVPILGCWRFGGFFFFLAKGPWFLLSTPLQETLVYRHDGNYYHPASKNPPAGTLKIRARNSLFQNRRGLVHTGLPEHPARGVGLVLEQNILARALPEHPHAA